MGVHSLKVNQEKCNGCRLCQLACVTTKKKSSGLKPALINIYTNAKGKGIATTCNQCQDEAVCETACLMEVIYKDKDGLTKRNVSDCFGCEACVVMCPFGAAIFDHEELKAFNCDQCNGKPVCVDICPTGALEYVDMDEESMKKRILAGERMALGGKTGAQIAR